MNSWKRRRWKACKSLKRNNVKEKVKVYYAGNNDLDSSAYPFQNEAIKAVGAEPAVDMNNQKMDADFIILNDSTCLDEFSEENTVFQGKYIVSPALFHNWLGFSMFAQVIGMVWMGYIFYPQLYSSVVIEIIPQFYKLFYSYNLNDDDLISIIFGENDK